MNQTRHREERDTQVRDCWGGDVLLDPGNVLLLDLGGASFIVVY